MRTILLLIILSLILISCGDDNNANIQGVGGRSKSYRGFNIIGASEKCEIPSSDIICPAGLSESGQMNVDFAAICEASKGRSFDCGCKDKVLCTVKLDVLTSGYDSKGKKRRAIPHEDILECPDSGSFPSDTTGELEEDFRSRCESLGHAATLTGCSHKRYLCSVEI